MGMGYLLCRLADTIADSLNISTDKKMDLLLSFKGLFQTFPISPKKLKELGETLRQANTLSPISEGKLFTPREDHLLHFNNLSRTDQSLIQEVVWAVIQGMVMDLEMFGSPSRSAKALPTQELLENYLLWIGGEPGRFWSKVCLEHFPSLEIKNRQQWIDDGIQFGKGLQMVNILRDLPFDIKKGRCYIPWDLTASHGLKLGEILEGKKTDFFLTLYHHLLGKAFSYLEHGLTYIHQIPSRHFRLRLAVWWPLSLGAKTLERLKLTPSILDSKTPIKVPRWEVFNLLAKSLVIIPSNRLLKKGFGLDPTH